MRLRAVAAALAVALTSWLAAAAGTDAHAQSSCTARPVVDAFIAALNGGDLARLDELFAAKSEGWVWYFVNDPAGQRLGAASRRRDTLGAYLAARIKQREKLELLRFEDGGTGNFTFVLRRRADDLRRGRPVVRVGKGWVSCRTEKLGVWGLGGAPTPPTFGPCVRGALPLAAGDAGAAAAAVLRFVRDVYAELVPSLDVTRARVTRSALAAGNVLGYAARVRCGREVQQKTIVVEVRFPRARAGDPAATGAFYVSRTRTGWLVWRLIR